jgi:hypothetical protein
LYAIDWVSLMLHTVLVGIIMMEQVTQLGTNRQFPDVETTPLAEETLLLGPNDRK